MSKDESSRVFALHLFNMDIWHHFGSMHDAVKYGKDSGFQFAVWLYEKGRISKIVYCNS